MDKEEKADVMYHEEIAPSVNLFFQLFCCRLKILPCRFRMGERFVI